MTFELLMRITVVFAAVGYFVQLCLRREVLRPRGLNLRGRVEWVGALCIGLARMTDAEEYAVLVGKRWRYHECELQVGIGLPVLCLTWTRWWKHDPE